MCPYTVQLLLCALCDPIRIINRNNKKKQDASSAPAKTTKQAQLGWHPPGAASPEQVPSTHPLGMRSQDSFANDVAASCLHHDTNATLQKPFLSKAPSSPLPHNVYALGAGGCLER